ncbi:MAG: hypothetical protein VB857_11750 [Pirellulaceae bacterium]
MPAIRLFLAALTLSVVAPALLQAQEAVDFKNLSDEAIANWGQSQHVFQGKLTAIVPGPVALTFPPIYNYRLTFQVTSVLRGSTAAAKPVTCFYSVRQKSQPEFPEGKECLVAAETSRGSLKAVRLEKLATGNLNDARFATMLPLGWSFRDGKLSSPWAALGKEAWPASQRKSGFLACSQTGRPVLLAGPDVQFTVAPVPPVKKVKFSNPDGDGQYKITLSNTTDKPVTVPALRSAKGKLLWLESIVILCQKTTYPAPGSQGLSSPTEPVVLKPGESVSTVVNALTLQGPEWPRGGYRIAFQFCLGEQSNVQSFYYLSRHHDPIREKLLKKAP